MKKDVMMEILRKTILYPRAENQKNTSEAIIVGTYSDFKSFRHATWEVVKDPNHLRMLGRDKNFEDILEGLCALYDEMSLHKVTAVVITYMGDKFVELTNTAVPVAPKTFYAEFCIRDINSELRRSQETVEERQFKKFVVLYGGTVVCLTSILYTIPLVLKILKKHV